MKPHVCPECAGVMSKKLKVWVCKRCGHKLE
jgi:ribosomal protein L37AE/L43A